VLLVKTFPFGMSLFALHEWRSLPRGHGNRKYVGLVGSLFFGAGIWFNTLYVFEDMEKKKSGSKSEKQ
jgi:hypothetical protein